MRILIILFLAAVTLLGLALSSDAITNQQDEDFALNASYYAPGAVMLYWTAPGDNGYVGRAVGYELRYQTCYQGPINSDDRWRGAIPIIGLPHPSQAGRKDSMLVEGLEDRSRYYFCIRAYDLAGNASALSNSPLILVGFPDSCEYLGGDVNGDGRILTTDVTYLINYLYKGGETPFPPETGDINGSGNIRADDITSLVNFLFKCGSVPACNSLP